MIRRIRARNKPQSAELLSNFSLIPDYQGICSSEVCCGSPEKTILTKVEDLGEMGISPKQADANLGVAERLESAIVELLALQEVLSSDEVDPAVLRDFRDALNRVRNTAWAAQKYVESQMFDEGPAGLAAFLAGERVRYAFQLCRSVKEDLQDQAIEFQKGQLVELQSAVTELGKQLRERF